jgi:hypothetical protein
MRRRGPLPKPPPPNNEDEKGRWHTETASGRDRPVTEVKDKG